MEELRSFPLKTRFLTLRCTHAYPSFQTPVSISLWLVISLPEMSFFFFLSESLVAKDIVSSCCVFTFYFLDKTVSLQRNSNLIFNIFSMKEIKSINSLQKERNTVGYSKERITMETVFLRFCTLQAPGTTKWRKAGEGKRRNTLLFLLSLKCCGGIAVNYWLHE